MISEILRNHWNNGLIITLISFIESFFKLSFAIAELVLGHFKNTSPYETRVFIHSIMFTVIGALGIICSYFLYDGLTNNKKYSRIIYWMCLQGISIFHQIFFSIEIILIVHYFIARWSINFIVIFLLLLFLSLEIKFFTKIIVIYQKIEEKEAQPRTPRVVSAWRIPTISELLDNQEEIGQSTPPVWTLIDSSNNGNESKA